MARLHSLRFGEAERCYADILDAEPNCAIAYWGTTVRSPPGLSGERRPVFLRHARNHEGERGRLHHIDGHGNSHDAEKADVRGPERAEAGL